MKTFEAIKGYSKPVVRVSENGKVLFTLSFTDRGFPINRPDNADIDLCMEAWKVWKVWKATK